VEKASADFQLVIVGNRAGGGRSERQQQKDYDRQTQSYDQGHDQAIRFQLTHTLFSLAFLN
jgi:hypothetical protein